MSEVYLVHHGIKGQKWGVRRYQNKDGTLTAAGRRRQSKAVIKDRRQAVKDRRLLSDEELDNRIKRLEKEKRLRELSESEVTSGKRYTKDILKAVGTKVLVPALAGSAAYVAKYYITKNFDRNELAKYVAPNPNVKKK